MKKLLLIAILIYGTAMASDHQQSHYSPKLLSQVKQLRDYALNDMLAYELTESLTTEVGARLAGSEGDAKAVAWAKAKFNLLGFDRVTLEPVTFRRWVRGEETAEIISPYQQPLTITALGQSTPTPKEGITGQVIHFSTLEELKTANPEEIKGKITFISNRMERHKDGSGYGTAVAARSSAAQVTAAKGGIGTLIRSIGTDNNRTPHTGVMNHDDNISTVPAGALSNPDADLLVNILKRDQAVILRFTLGSDFDGEYTSYNVIGDMLGSEQPDEYIIIGGHLDSWDLGTGAIDDASGCAITMATAKLIKEHIGQPKRTIRVILWANEEYGLSGAKAYYEAHQGEMKQHILGGESDFGAGNIYAFGTRIDNKALPLINDILNLLKPLGIDYAGNQSFSGADLTPLREAGMAVFSLAQDGTEYFDYHHTANDTLDKIDPQKLAQNVAAWVVVTALVANTTENFGFNLQDSE